MRVDTRPVTRWLQEAPALVRERWQRASELWRRSLQLRVVVSTLALSSAVVFVLGMVLQSQITDQMLSSKTQAATVQIKASVKAVQHQLVGVSPGPDSLGSRFNAALNSLTSSGSANVDGSSAGAFEPILADARTTDAAGNVTATTHYADIPDDLKRFVLNDEIASRIHTVMRDNVPTTMLMVGAQVPSTNHPVQLYLLFPLTPEQHTTEVVQNTLIVGGIALLLLLAGITNLVTRQVVRPVRQAAEVAERFADGKLDDRMPVVGEDDVARLAESYNEMAESIQAQIRQLEEFGLLQRRFTSDVSHELRTPLTTVRMAADVLHASREQFPAGLARSTELLVDELDRFEALLGDLLEISRLDAGVDELAADLVDVRGVVERAVLAVGPVAASSGSPVEMYLPDVEVPAEVDARRVERVLRNLLNNAVDHGEGLPVRVRVAADENAVAIVVRDFGVGLRDGEAELVFNRFWRADPSRNRRTGGTGLGLAISVEDARLHGGWLEAWGALGQGACFRLTLPRRQGAELTDSPLPLPPDEVRPVREGEEDEVSPLVVTEVDAEAQVEDIAWQSADSVELDEATPDLPIAWHSASAEPASPAPDHGEIGPDPELDDVHRPPPTGVPDRADSAVVGHDPEFDDVPTSAPIGVPTLSDPSAVGHDPEFDDVPSSAPESGDVPDRAGSAVIGHDPEFDDVPGPASASAGVGHDPEFDDVPGGGGSELASKSAGEAR
ncbi:sensor histidine kinase MtrB [Kutzneria sp. 744]|nr:sensor histidine kinase MtrB [Kutzneria sp. 744]